MNKDVQDWQVQQLILTKKDKNLMSQRASQEKGFMGGKRNHLGEDVRNFDQKKGGEATS